MDEGCRIEFDRESIASVKSGEVKPEVVEMSPELRKRFFIILAVIAGCVASLIPYQ